MTNRERKERQTHSIQGRPEPVATSRITAGAPAGARALIEAGARPGARSVTLGTGAAAADLDPVALEAIITCPGWAEKLELPDSG